MASVNKVILLGNLGADPDVRYSSDNSNAIASLSIATNRRYRNRDGQPVSETEWHRVVLFGRLAEIAKDYLRKGRSVYIEGRLRTRKWTDQQGIDRYTTEIIGEVMQLLSGRDDGTMGGMGGDSFESRPRPAPQQNYAAPAQPHQAAPQPAAVSLTATSSPIDQLEEDVPF